MKPSETHEAAAVREIRRDWLTSGGALDTRARLQNSEGMCMTSRNDSSWLALLRSCLKLPVRRPPRSRPSGTSPLRIGVQDDILSQFKSWRGRDGNDPSFDIAKDAERRF